MSIAPLDARETLALLKNVVNEYGPDHIYERNFTNASGCVYAENGRPSCLVGIVLHRSGRFALDNLIALDEDSYGTGSAACAIVLAFPDRLTNGAAAVLQAAQSEQDEGKPWGEALSAAENRFQALDAGQPPVV
jgi:hypothetical protein